MQCVHEQTLIDVIQNITATRAQMDTCVQMQLFATFMIVIALYDVGVNVRRYVREEVLIRVGRR